MARRAKQKIEYNSEFELDLAPLLAVMVKLVPVLLLSSAFVQVMMVETELPQVVQAAIEEQEKNPNPEELAKIEFDLRKDRSVSIIITKGKEETSIAVPAKDSKFDLAALHARFVDVKRLHPKVFRVDVKPDAEVAYNEVIKVIDEARKARDPKTQFPVFDSKQGKEVMTEYMFPEIVFANVMEG